ncbi:hypothetical protein J8273_5137 [Carpediemonas membranifera]|uniref:Uncharacterized protein n=1 Tax=Carpediemonas membranifera TaxID=201153 RepID=A0A8J6E0Q9_9EUKA|nr:hypothetical protein J8273_5137 [Carpediemonas membranifera]|eukprot:KAG9392156.1 hypothetical protein J8273_5137 [Carpediemonas membranifera]
MTHPKLLHSMIAIVSTTTNDIVSMLLMVQEGISGVPNFKSKYVVTLGTKVAHRGKGYASILLAVASAGAKLRLQCDETVLEFYKELGFVTSLPAAELESIEDTSSPSYTLEAALSGTKWEALGQSLADCVGCVREITTFLHSAGDAYRRRQGLRHLISPPQPSNDPASSRRQPAPTHPMPESPNEYITLTQTEDDLTMAMKKKLKSIKEASKQKSTNTTRSTQRKMIKHIEEGHLVFVIKMAALRSYYRSHADRKKDNYWEAAWNIEYE